MAKTRTFIPPEPVYMRRSAEITNVRTSPAAGRAVPRELTKFPRASQQPNRPGPALKPRMVDEETERAEMLEAAILLHTRTLLSQVSGVPLDQIHTLIS